MQVAFGISAHSGWAALVVAGMRGDAAIIVDRRRLELIEEAWVKHAYHAAAKLGPEAARELVARGREIAHRGALEALRASLALERGRANEVAACAVLVGDPMPDWSVEQIIAVHPRMHRAEGVLFRDALLNAAVASGLRSLPLPLKRLGEHAERALGWPASEVQDRLAALGRSLGPPWAKDQKDAALAALIGLSPRSAPRREPGRSA